MGTHTKRVLALLTSSLAIFAADPAVQAPPDAFQLRYVANLTAGDSFINITNAGSQGGFDPTGAICANIYTFDPSQAMVACCSCYLAPNSLRSLSARLDLNSNTLTPTVSTSLVVKLLATSPVGGTCNAASPTAADLASGMRATASSVHALPTGAYATTETDFSKAVLSTTELTKLTLYCGFIQSVGIGFGICKSCRKGGLGGTKAE